jgi:hypothetical protein
MLSTGIRNETLEADEWPAAADSADIDWSDMDDDDDIVFGQPVLQVVSDEVKEDDLPPAPDFELDSD